jgi:hypothetical protein
LFAIYRNATYYVTGILIMNAAAGFADMAFTRIIGWNFDRQYSGAVRAILHADFLKMGFDGTA